jgi:radical SAM/Cys-rich protein
MNAFERILEESSVGELRATDIETMQVNVGLRCNQQCVHCHVEASPDRTEMMTWETMERIITIARKIGCRNFDITGGSPELNPNLVPFIKALRDLGGRVMVRTNLTIFQEPGMDHFPEIYRQNGVELIASLPCYLEEKVCAQRGKGTYEKSIEGLRLLNQQGYGIDPELLLSLVFNPDGPFLPPDQFAVEHDFRTQLKERFGISFTNLLTITNMPIGRFLEDLRENDQVAPYFSILRDSFNPCTIDNLMCRHHINIGWDGTLYDCDFNMALGLPVAPTTPSSIHTIDVKSLLLRKIVTGDHCLGCTAGRGSSCGGVLI